MKYKVTRCNANGDVVAIEADKVEVIDERLTLSKKVQPAAGCDDQEETYVEAACFARGNWSHYEIAAEV